MLTSDTLSGIMLSMSSYYREKENAIAFKGRLMAAEHRLTNARRECDMSNEKKIALITGANKGIGFEIARQLGVQGITVLVGARDQVRGEEAAEKLRAGGLDAHYVQLDVTDQTTISTAVSAI